MKVENEDITYHGLIEIHDKEFSAWECRLFGATGGFGFAWIPEKGKVPNWFWRKMQYLCFGNRWVKRS